MRSRGTLCRTNRLKLKGANRLSWLHNDAPQVIMRHRMQIKSLGTFNRLENIETPQTKFKSLHRFFSLESQSRRFWSKNPSFAVYPPVFPYRPPSRSGSNYVWKSSKAFLDIHEVDAPVTSLVWTQTCPIKVLIFYEYILHSTLKYYKYILTGGNPTSLQAICGPGGGLWRCFHFYPLQTSRVLNGPTKATGKHGIRSLLPRWTDVFRGKHL